MASDRLTISQENVTVMRVYQQLYLELPNYYIEYTVTFSKNIDFLSIIVCHLKAKIIEKI